MRSRIAFDCTLAELVGLARELASAGVGQQGGDFRALRRLGAEDAPLHAAQPGRAVQLHRQSSSVTSWLKPLEALLREGGVLPAILCRTIGRIVSLAPALPAETVDLLRTLVEGSGNPSFVDTARRVNRVRRSLSCRSTLRNFARITDILQQSRGSS